MILANGSPSMDERLKSILAAAYGDLLRGGYDEFMIRRVARGLVLEYNDVIGHSKLAHLRAHVRAEAEGIEERAHAQRKREEPRDNVVSFTTGTCQMCEWNLFPGHLHKPNPEAPR